MTTISGTLHQHSDFRSAFVAARNVDIWLPPGYDESDTPFPVIYMHDGQNLFQPAVASGYDWGVAPAMSRLIEAGKTSGAIVVGIWNTDDRRWLEYMPDKAQTPPPAPPREGGVERPPARGGQKAGEAPLLDLPPSRGGAGGGKVPPHTLSDPYLHFLVQEVKPFVDAHYRTLRERTHTFVMGSSMGGLISLYAMCEYPDVFAGAGCVSTHWPAGDGIVLDYLRRALPAPGSHRFYFDYGTETLDAEYEVYQRQADEIMRAAGYQEGADWITLKFPGAEHSERAWRERVHVPLLFLLEGRTD